MTTEINPSLVLTDKETAKKLGLLESEFEKICEHLGRTPNFNELSVYSVMWSEHCSYKNSILHLKKLPRKGKHLLVEAGEENAGLVDLGGGLACAFKIESHNHPSAVEPYQGAATGVGGIHRDIFTMGARPIASLNSLRFGLPQNSKTKHLLKGVVKGIGDYGNAFGVPTVGGEVYFDDCYQTNPLVNAMSVGIVDSSKTISAISYGVGNLVYIVGSSTGKDGIAGAAFASKDISDNAMDDLPAVQVGDPFQEKLLLEASLELANTDAVIGMQDMGAAGITCSTSEMSAKGNSGMKIYLDKVPTRQDNMKAWEILLSESQERMLVVVKKGKEAIVEEIFDKWDLNCVCIGEVTDSEWIEYYMDGELAACVPAQSLVLGGGAPVYVREVKEPTYLAQLDKNCIDKIPLNENFADITQQLLALPNIASKKWIYEQYDSMVGIVNTNINESSDACVIRIDGTQTCLALTVDCNSRYIWANPYQGAMIAVSEAARNIVCSGGQPSAITNCLNFGNPYDPEVYWTFAEALRGMGDACKKFDTPVTGGNVSFYNQSSTAAVYPTPTIGMIGVLNSIEQRMTLGFKNEGDSIYLIGKSRNDLNSSQYIAKIIGNQNTACPYFDLEEEYALQQTIIACNAKKLLNSAHDVSEGGLIITLLEAAFANKMGFEINTDKTVRKDAFLFGESQSRVVVSVSQNHETALESLFSESKVAFIKLGKVQAKNALVDGENLGSIAELKAVYDNSLAAIIEGE